MSVTRRRTIRQIARAANVTSASLYNYFPNKSDLMKATIEARAQAALPRLRQAARCDGDVVDRIESVLDECGNLIREYPDLAAFEWAIRAENVIAPAEQEGVDAGFQNFRGIIEDLVQDAHRRGELGDHPDPQGAVEAIYSLIYGLTELAATLPQEDYWPRSTRPRRWSEARYSVAGVPDAIRGFDRYRWTGVRRRCAAPEVRRRAGQSAAPGRDRPVRGDRGGVRPGTPRIPGRTGKFAREPLTDEVDVAIVGAGFGGLLTGVRLRGARCPRCPFDRQGGRRGRHLVLEPLSGDRLRHRVLGYMPLLEELGYIPKRQVRQGRGDLCALPAHRPSLRAVPRRVPAGRCHEIRWDEAIRAGSIPTSRGDEIRARFVIMAIGSASSPSCPASPASRSSAGTHSIPAVGTTSTPAANEGG